MSQENLVNIDGRSKYAGNILMTTRVVINVADFLRDSQERSFSFDDPNFMDKFVDYLSFLDTIISSRAIFYDGTVGGNKLKDLNQAEEFIETKALSFHSGARDMLTAANPSLEQLTQLCELSATRGSMTIIEGIESFEGTEFNEMTDSAAVDAMANRFLNLPQSAADMRSLAIETIHDNPFPGAKCFAGILLHSATQIDRLEKDTIAATCREYYRRHTTSQKRAKLHAFLMNGVFRPNLLPYLANEHCDAAFSAGPELTEPCIDQHRRYASYLLARHYNSEPQQIAHTQRLVDCIGGKTDHAPWFGLHRFLSSRSTDPFEILAEAFDDRRKLVAKVNENFSMNARYFDDSEVADEAVQNQFVSQQYSNVFERVEQVRTKKPHVLKIGFALPPQLVSLVVGVSAGATASTLGSVETVSDAMQILGELNEFFQGLPPDAGSIAKTYQRSPEDLANEFRLHGFTDEFAYLCVLNDFLKKEVTEVLHSDQDLGILLDDRIRKTFQPT